MSDKENNISNEVTLSESIDKEKLKSQIYEIRGMRVMLDSDIAEYFGVETGALNRAMKRNIKRFPSTFCFKLTKDETAILKCQFGISSSFGNYGGRRTLPNAYTEQGVAMLTSCLHTERAIYSSIKIIEAFVEMSHYLHQSGQLYSYQKITQLSDRQNKVESDVENIKTIMVTKSDLSDLIKLFENSREAEEILILNGEPFKADVAYQRIYGKAKKNIIIIDDYIGVKTLHHLASAGKNVSVTIITDNKGAHPLRKNEYEDYMTEYPDREISFIRSDNKIHDRYIIMDNETRTMKVYLCGSSSKDSGKKITTIMQVRNVDDYKSTLRKLLLNGKLELK